MQDLLSLESDEDTQRLVLETMEECEAGGLSPTQLEYENIAELWDHQVLDDEADPKVGCDALVNDVLGNKGCNLGRIRLH